MDQQMRKKILSFGLHDVSVICIEQELHKQCFGILEPILNVGLRLRHLLNYAHAKEK